MAKTEIRQLPKEIIPQTTRNQIVGVVLGVIACAIVFNILAVFYLAVYSPNTGYLLIAEKWKIMRSLAHSVDLLVLGDSSGNQGVDPEIIKNRIGLSSVNLCTIGGTIALNDAYMLEDYIDRYGPPKAVLIVHGYDVWSRGIDDNISSLSKVPGDWWNRQPQLDLEAKNRIRVYLNRYVPLYAETWSLGQIMQHPFIAFKRSLQHLDANGFMHEIQADPEAVEKDIAVHREYIGMLDDSDPIAEPNRRALAYVGELAQKYDFDVFIANGPVYDHLASDPAFRDYYDRLRTAMMNIVESHPRLHYILDPPVTYDATQMQSVDHIVGPAVIDYTARIAREIQAILDPAP